MTSEAILNIFVWLGLFAAVVATEVYVPRWMPLVYYGLWFTLGTLFYDAGKWSRSLYRQLKTERKRNHGE